MQREQLILPKDLTQEIGLPFQRISIETLSLTSLELIFSPFVKWVAKCLAKVSDVEFLVTRLLTSLKCWFILFFNVLLRIPNVEMITIFTSSFINNN